VVGVGSIGERHLRCFQQVGCRVALVEVDDARRKDVAGRYSLEQAFASLEPAAAQAWDAAVICTPANLHVEHALKLLDRTPALLIEKPLATRLEDARRLQKAAAGKTVQIAYVLRGHPAVQAVREEIRSGRLGKLLEVVVTSGQHFPTFRPAYRQIYYTRRETGGGAVQDAATHLFDLSQYVAGRFDWVFCDFAHQALEGVEVEDTVHAVARADGGKVLVSVSLNQFMAPNETVARFNGSQGTAEIRFHEARWGVFYHGDEAWKWGEPLVQERDDLFRLQARRFLDASAGKGEILCTLDEALHTLAINLAALESNGARQVPIVA